MKNKKIIESLKQLSTSEDKSIEQEIALGALNTDDPIQFLKESYQDTSLLYHFDESFFDMYYDEIERLRIKHVQSNKKEVSIGTWDLKISLSYFTYQKVLGKMLIQFGLAKKVITIKT